MGVMIVIIFIIILWTLCSIYMINIFNRKKMKLSSYFYVALYSVIISWLISILIADINNTGLSIIDYLNLCFNDVYKSYVSMINTLDLLPFNMGLVYTVLSVLLSVIVLFTIINGFLQIYKEIKTISLPQFHFGSDYVYVFFEKLYVAYIVRIRLWLRHCRMIN